MTPPRIPVEVIAPHGVGACQESAVRMESRVDLEHAIHVHIGRTVRCGEYTLYARGGLTDIYA
jgi:hypothetical protein